MSASADLFSWRPSVVPATTPERAPAIDRERILVVRDLSFACPGCGEPVFHPFAPSNQVLLCDRCRMWGTEGHRQLRKLGAELDALSGDSQQMEMGNA